MANSIITEASNNGGKSGDPLFQKILDGVIKLSREKLKKATILGEGANKVPDQTWDDLLILASCDGISNIVESIDLAIQHAVLDHVENVKSALEERFKGYGKEI